MKKIQVVEVTEPPAIGKIAMMSGIRTREGAEAWAAKNGYPTVYFWKSRERVYADKLSRVDVAAKSIEKQSDHLLQLSETGAGCVEFMLLIALIVVLLMFYPGPW